MAKSSSKHVSTKIRSAKDSKEPNRELADPVPNVAIIYTGGTIGMHDAPLKPMNKAEFLALLGSIRGFMPTADGLHLVLPSIHPNEPRPRRIRLEFVGDRKAIDSSRMMPINWAEIAAEVRRAQDSGKYAGVVVLHGTDTLAWTASALSFLVGEIKIPVVMTGSQTALSHSRSDALRNLITAVEFAAHKKCPKEVCIFFDQVLLRGNRATKYRSSGFDGFETPNFSPLGWAGTHLSFAEGVASWPMHGGIDLIKWSKNVAQTKVLVIRAYPGLNAFPRLPPQSTRLAIILEAYGAGTANSAGGLESFLRRAKAKNKAHIVLRTQVTNGTVETGVYEAGNWLDGLVIPGSNITSEACVAKLYYLLGLDRSSDFVENAMQSSLCGEADLRRRPLENDVLGASVGYEGPVGNWPRFATFSDTARLQANLAATLARVPGAIVAQEASMNGEELDIAAFTPLGNVGIECSGGLITVEKARRDFARLERSGVERRILVGALFSISALDFVAKSGGTALTWGEAFSHDWSTLLKIRGKR